MRLELKYLSSSVAILVTDDNEKIMIDKMGEVYTSNNSIKEFILKILNVKLEEIKCIDFKIPNFTSECQIFDEIEYLTFKSRQLIFLNKILIGFIVKNELNILKEFSNNSRKCLLLNKIYNKEIEKIKEI